MKKNRGEGKVRKIWEDDDGNTRVKIVLDKRDEDGEKVEIKRIAKFKKSKKNPPEVKVLCYRYVCFV